MSDISKFTPLWGVWEVEEILGEGSFGKVYKAVRNDFGRQYECAIKHISLPQNEAEIKHLMDEQFTNDTSMASDYYRQVVEDFTGEISIMHSLRGNTNIVAYEDHLIIPKADGIGYDIFIRMELLTGLSDKVKQSMLSEQDVIKLGIDVCTALEVCAAKNLIHRDIKPQNVFVNQEGHYKLGDFGISRRLEKTTSGLSKKGTYSYMAPEVYKGEEYGINVDIYSLGLLMYRLLNGSRLPFLPPVPEPVRYDDNEKALKRRIDGEPIPPPVYAGAELSRIISKMCAFDRNERYMNAGDVKSELLQLLDSSQEVTAMPVVAPVAAPVSAPDESAYQNDNIETTTTANADNEESIYKTESTVGLFGRVTPKVEEQQSTLPPETPVYPQQTYPQEQQYVTPQQQYATPPQQPPQKPPQQPPSEQKKKKSPLLMIGIPSAAVVILVVILIIAFSGGGSGGSPQHINTPVSTPEPTSDPTPEPIPASTPETAPASNNGQVESYVIVFHNNTEYEIDYLEFFPTRFNNPEYSFNDDLIFYRYVILRPGDSTSITFLDDGTYGFWCLNVRFMDDSYQAIERYDEIYPDDDRNNLNFYIQFNPRGELVVSRIRAT